MGLLAMQPFKGLYLLGAVTFELARLPFWLVKYFTVYGRQHPEWSFQNAFVARFACCAIYHIAKIQLKTPLPLSPGKEKERFVVIKAAPERFYIGPFTPNKDIEPVDVGASWYPAPLTTSSDTSNATVVLHFHGGAYVLGDGRSDSMGSPAHKLLKHAGVTHVLAPAYRLSTLPASRTSNPFPAALQDCLTAYLYLIGTLKMSSKNIIVSGDSAGGNAAISLIRYIAEYGADLDISSPGAAWIWSPWIEPSEAIDRDSSSTNLNHKTDYLPALLIDWGARAYCGLAGQALLNSPYISFKGKPFKTQVPLWVHTGAAEVLFFDDKQWAEEMEVHGNKVTLDVEENAPHDILAIGSQLGFDAQLSAAAQRAGEWLRSVRH